MEHRYSLRRRCGENALVYSPRYGLASARVRDLSATGMFLETAARWPRHALVHVAFGLGTGDARCDFYLAASVVRHAPGGIGLVFVDAADLSLAILQDLLARSAAPADAASPALADGRAPAAAAAPQSTARSRGGATPATAVGGSRASTASS
jgi:hypothetical protein